MDKACLPQDTFFLFLVILLNLGKLCEFYFLHYNILCFL